MEAQYNPQTGDWEVLATWFDPHANSYAPQSGDIVVLYENNEPEFVFQNATAASNTIIGQSYTWSVGKTEEKDSVGIGADSGIGYFDLELECATVPGVGDSVTDRVLVIARAMPLFSYGWLRFRVIRSIFGQGCGGSSGGSVTSIPNNPNNTEDGASCGSIEVIRQNYAKQEIGPFLNVLRINQIVEIRYLNGETERFRVACKHCHIPAVPVPDTCE